MPLLALLYTSVITYNSLCLNKIRGDITCPLLTYANWRQPKWSTGVSIVQVEATCDMNRYQFLFLLVTLPMALNP